MTPSQTDFAGLELLAPGDPLSADGYRFQAENPRITDFLLKLGAVLHKHDAHAALADPTVAATVTVSASGGAVPAGTTIYLAYTLNDAAGGETLPTAVETITVPTVYTTPAGAPAATPGYTAGSLLASTPMYAVSVTDGHGGETALGPTVSVTVDPSVSGHAEVVLSGLTALTDAASGSDTTAGWRLWRSMDGGNDWDLMATGPAATDTWTDDGTTPGDCSVSPLTVGTTGDTGSFTVTVPSAGQPAGASFFNVYACTDGLFYTPSLLGTYPTSDYDSTQTFASLPLQAGRPPVKSTCVGGANRIDPDTDILGWPWKRPVANVAALPATGNSDGDMRETLDTHTLYVWNAGSSSWGAGGGAVGPAGPAGTNGTDGTNGARGSLWYIGSGAPSTGSPAGMAADDIYLDKTSGIYYQTLDGNTWTAEGTINDTGVVASNLQAASYILVLTDQGLVVEMNLAAAGTVTVPPHSSVAFPVGTVIEVFQLGAGQITLTAGAGVTFQSDGGLVKTRAQYATVGLRQRALDEWVLTGDLA